MFKKQADPHARADKALAVFNGALDELREAVAEHHAIADEAADQSNQLLAIAADHKVAAHNHERRLSKLAEFLA